MEIGQPGISASLKSLLRKLDDVVEMKGFGNFSNIDEKLRNMKSSLLGFGRLLLDGERKRLHGDEEVNEWMDQLKDSFYDIDDLLDEIEMEKQPLQPKIGGQPSNNQVDYQPLKSYYITNDIEKRLGEVVGMLVKHTTAADLLNLKRYEAEHHASWLKFHNKFRSEQGCFPVEYIHVRDEDENRIIELLLTEDGGESKGNFEFVCVVGMGGLGKTTLAQCVFHDERVERSFPVRSWAYVSDVVDVFKVIQTLIETAAEIDEEGGGAANMPSSLAALQKRLKKTINGQKFLLVLDDVWTTKNLEPLNGLLKFGAKGSKILVTTRLSKVAEDLGNNQPYLLGRLNDAQCLKIFKHYAFGDENGIEYDEDLMQTGEEIVRKCQGVPLAAKIIGSSFIPRDKAKWKAMKDNDIWKEVCKNKDFDRGLRLNYFYLPPFLKRCFEYLVLFPSDFKFKECIRLWMAEGLIEVEVGKEVEEVGNQYYNYFKGRSLIEKNDKIHNMVHHLASMVCGSSFFRCSSGFSSSTSSLESVRHAFIENKLELLIDSRKLRTLIYEGDFCEELFSDEWWRNLKVSRSTYCIPNLKYLRYLKLSGKFRNCTLPDSICTLTNLQVLDLSFFLDLKNLPQDVGKLSNLWFLGLCATGINSLPNSVCSLLNLRVLDVSSCKSLTTLPNDMGSLYNLQTRVMFDGSSISI